MSNESQVVNAVGVARMNRERIQEIADEVRDIVDNMAVEIEQLASICDELNDNQVRSYLIAPLQIMVEQGSWLSNDMTLYQWLREIENKEEEDEFEN